jgi:hypothetical protein
VSPARGEPLPAGLRPALVVDIGIAASDPATPAGPRHERHVLRGRLVEVTASPGCGQASTSYPVGDWARRLTECCRLEATEGDPPPDDDLELPWELVIGTGAALAQGRADLYDALVTRAGVPPEQLRRLHGASLGRLRAVGLVPAGRRVGWISWVRYVDGWRALRPRVGRGPDGPRAMVGLERRQPRDLAAAVARWAAVAR